MGGRGQSQRQKWAGVNSELGGAAHKAFCVRGSVSPRDPPAEMSEPPGEAFGAAKPLSKGRELSAREGGSPGTG